MLGAFARSGPAQVLSGRRGLYCTSVITLLYSRVFCVFQANFQDALWEPVLCEGFENIPRKPVFCVGFQGASLDGLRDVLDVFW